MFNYVKNFMKYRNLLNELVSRDIKVKYKKSILGILWTLLNPLLNMIILSIVFSNIFKNDIENFPVYLITGQVMFNFFSEATTISMDSIIGNSSLIKKVYIPKYMFPLSKVMSSFINLLFSLIAVVIIMVMMKIRIEKSILFLPILFIYIFTFSLGVSLILSSLNVFFRDIRHLYGVLLTVWTYLTPIFYPIDIIPIEFKWIVENNPLYIMITYFRYIVLYGQIPTFEMNVSCIISCTISLFIGIFTFYKSQDKFILHI